MGVSQSPDVVVVTGGTSGVGRATVRAFAVRGARVGILARGAEGLEGARRDVMDAGSEALAIETDVSDPEQVRAAAAAIEDALGPIDVWVNNAMTSVFAPVVDISPDEFRRVTEVTYLGAVFGTMAALERMEPRGGGVIVQVGSALAYRGIPLQSAYSGAKHAIQGFTDSLRSELLHAGSAVRVTMVQMPALNTPQFDVVLNRLPHEAQPVPPIYQPEIAAEAIVWAAEHSDRREHWVGASTVGTILGNRVVPGLLDRYLARTGFKSQQTGASADPDRPSNLWEPVPGDHGAHGRFDARAHDRSAQLWLATRGRLPAAAAAGITAAALIAVRARTRAGRTGWTSRIRSAIRRSPITR